MDVLVEAEQRQATAFVILEKLRLFERWSIVGRPVLVGAAAYGLIVTPDIDLEIFCRGDPIETGFGVLSACAAVPGTTKARFSNRLQEQDEGIYWQIRHRHDDEEWKIDMWTLREDHPGPLSTSMVEPMRAALTVETRCTMLKLKHALALRPELSCGSIHLYQAVLDHGVTTMAEFQTWQADHDTASLTTWTPK